MLILSHRGYWKNASEKNSQVAFKRSFNLDFGTETDVRDCAGRLVISHDMPSVGVLDLSNFLQLHQKKHLPLAINIKSDGLVTPLKRAMETAEVSDWFVFDMSIPDMRCYIKAGVPVFARMSEVEKTVPWADEISGIWLDAFSGQWYDLELISSLLGRGLRVCVVSPELHSRGYETFWTQLKLISNLSGLMLCTDFPEQANAFFHH